MMKYLVRKSVIEVVGKIWMPGNLDAASRLTLTPRDVDACRDENGKITRESVADWLTTHTGDFSHVHDFNASIEDGPDTIDLPWATEDGEDIYLNCTSEDIE